MNKYDWQSEYTTVAAYGRSTEDKMQFITPCVVIPGDNQLEIMARSGELVGVTRTRAVWRFGMMHDSDAARAHGVCTPAFFWYLTDKNGKILACFEGFACELPSQFKEIIDGAI